MARDAIDTNRAKVGIVSHSFNTGHGAGCEKCENALPVIGRTKTKMKNIFVIGLPDCLFCQSPDLRRCALIGLSHRGIEPSDAAKSRGERDFSHRQPGFIDQLLRKMKTPS